MFVVSADHFNYGIIWFHYLQLEEYIQTGGKDAPLLLLGEAGTGKSSVMAKAVHEFSKPGYLDKYLPQ